MDVMAILTSIVPDVDVAELRSTLEECDFDLARALDALMAPKGTRRAALLSVCIHALSTHSLRCLLLCRSHTLCSSHLLACARGCNSMTRRLRAAAAAVEDVSERYGSGGRKVCRYWFAGDCRRADCAFAHDIQQTTCKFWLRGQCLQGSGCPFLHGVDPSLVPEQEAAADAQEEVRWARLLPLIRRLADTALRGCRAGRRGRRCQTRRSG